MHVFQATMGNSKLPYVHTPAQRPSIKEHTYRMHYAWAATKTRLNLHISLDTATQEPSPTLSLYGSATDPRDRFQHTPLPQAKPAQVQKRVGLVLRRMWSPTMLRTNDQAANQGRGTRG
jgi:hypothetical protein